MNEKQFESCKWCNGSGNDGGGYNACPDCESTGLVGGRSALEAFEKMLDEKYEEHQKLNNHNMENNVQECSI